MKHLTPAQAKVEADRIRAAADEQYRLSGYAPIAVYQHSVEYAKARRLEKNAANRSR